MFAPEGWIPISEVYLYFSDYFAKNPSLGAIHFTGDEAYELTWDFAQCFDDAYICTANGSILTAPARLMQTENECNHENYHVNLYYGTVGSGEINALESFPDRLKSAREFSLRLYGPFLGCPIVFPREAFLDHLTFLANDAVSQEDHGAIEDLTTELDMSPRAVSKRILEVWKSNRSITSNEIKAIVAPTQSFRKFKFAWTLAAMTEPKISRPGRRSGS